MRAASEGEQGLQTSPYAVVYNFTPKKTEDVMYLRDITDGEKSGRHADTAGICLVLEERGSELPLRNPAAGMMPA